MKILINGIEVKMDPRELSNWDLIAIQKACGLRMKELADGLSSMDMEALTALLWSSRRKDEPALRYQDVTFLLGDMTAVGDDGVELTTEDEVREAVRAVADGGPLAPGPSASS